MTQRQLKRVATTVVGSKQLDPSCLRNRRWYHVVEQGPKTYFHAITERFEPGLTIREANELMEQMNSYPRSPIRSI
jgi:hypothetical protein